MLNACSAQTAIVYLANPNNPTGGFIPHAAIERLLQHIPETTILVLDEAYQEYLPQQHDLIANICAYPNLVITRTFSKAYGLAGLRLGYAIGNPQLIAWLLRIQLPFMVNVATLTAGIAALHDDEFVASSVRHNQLGLEQMLHGLHALQVTCLPAYGNFVTINCHADATPVYLALQKKGIIVRPLQPYGLGDYLRVTIGTPAQIKRFLQVLPECLPLAIRNDHA